MLKSIGNITQFEMYLRIFKSSQKLKILESRIKPREIKNWNNEIPTRKIFGPTKYLRGKFWTHDLVGTRYCGDIDFLLDFHRDVDRLRIDTEVKPLYIFL